MQPLLDAITPLITHIPHSRTHALKSFTGSCRTKREDELGFGISGTKLRKYVSLIPYLQKHSHQETIVIGSAYSNHVLSISQLLIENRIKPTLFLLGNPQIEKRGNLLLTSLLVPESQIHWIKREDWPHVEAIASAQSAFIIPEGACMDEALPGSLTLAVDILQHETPEHIFMDAGTGLSAIATLLAFAWLKKKTLLHILLLADDEPTFLQKLKRFQKTFEKLLNCEIQWDDLIAQFKLYRPTQARSFGSVNQTTIHTIKEIAREEGFLTDPIYSAKLFYEAKQIILSDKLEGTILIVHSGGALTLMGFEKQLLNPQ